MQPVLSFDIGSTYTKGALFDLASDLPRLVCRDAAPTTVSDLAAGFDKLRKRLLDAVSGCESQTAEIPIYACSSAKGGLAIAALGLVPDLTLHVAKLAAASAGGKIVAAHAYRLTDAEIGELRRNPPDVILFTGGTDGGNEDYVLRNAQILAEARLPSVILYAGNAALAGEVREILSDAELCIADNLMPDVGKLVIEPARAKIQEIFLKKIIEGKGLGAIRSHCAGEIKPTPRAVFDLLHVISERLPSWNDFLLLDLGGATTDCYSCSESFHGEDGYVLKGLCEPKLKRTVEGDLGLRISARSAAEAGREFIARRLGDSPSTISDFANYLERLSTTPDDLPQTPEEASFDEAIAGACVYHALRRHAGSIEERYSSSGKIFVQQGKDLRRVTKVILSGGYWQSQRLSPFAPRKGRNFRGAKDDETAGVCRAAFAAARRDCQGLQLLPERVEFYSERQYILPLLGNLVADCPSEASRLAEENLSRF
jgi:uncharacterized protein (TIGR01319 family)